MHRDGLSAQARLSGERLRRSHSLTKPCLRGVRVPRDDLPQAAVPFFPARAWAARVVALRLDRC
eukprot:10071809-Alexandrium_andersonii.AAC.1